MFLWNALLPDVFGLPVINYWQATGLFVLARILFGGFSGIGGAFGHVCHGQKNPIHDKWKNMSEEERFAFIKRHGGDWRGHVRHHFFAEDEEEKTGTSAKTESQSSPPEAEKK
jgi:hypothetical protein